jgi:hypothetical protein
MLRASAALLLAVGATARGIDPTYAQNLTLYHVNPLHEGVIPSDMDTSDLNGDIFFDLKSAVTPVECAPASADTMMMLSSKLEALRRRRPW